MQTPVLFRRAACATTLLLVAACDTSREPAGPLPQFSPGNAPATATGGGHMDLLGDGITVRFSFAAVQRGATDAATGQLRFETELGGQAIEFHGRVTCLAVDAATNRAWVAGVVTHNNSSHPSFTRAVNEVGRDIWFRVVDYGEGNSALQPDRATFVGFEGSAGIITSEEYCATRPWPGPPTDAVDARTNALTKGNIQVRG